MPTPRTDAGASDLAHEVLARVRADARARVTDRARGLRAADRRRDADQRREPRVSPASRPGIAAPGRDWQEPVAFGTAVETLLDAHGWREQARSAGLLARWDKLVGPGVAARCRPVGLRDSELVIVAESTAWATQLRLLERTLLARLHHELGPEIVSRVLVRGPSSPTWSHGPLRAPGSRGPRDTYG